ncbi:MAG: DUF2625 domain-containing protein [Polyangiaceae bacterium]
MRKLADLLVAGNPGWAKVKGWINKAKNHIEILPADRDRRGRALVAMQVTTNSPMGAIVYESGGILVDHGWLRILGSGHERLTRSLATWNEGKTDVSEGGAPPFLLIADDVVGGFFAVNGGAFDGPPGNVFYLAPDTLAWEDMELGYSQFIEWATRGDLERFYSGSRWRGWKDEVAKISGDQGISIYPFLFAEGPPLEERERKPVPIQELYALALKFGEQVRSGADTVLVKVGDDEPPN